MRFAFINNYIPMGAEKYKQLNKLRHNIWQFFNSHGIPLLGGYFLPDTNDWDNISFAVAKYENDWNKIGCPDARLNISFVDITCADQRTYHYIMYESAVQLRRVLDDLEPKVLEVMEREKLTDVGLRPVRRLLDAFGLHAKYFARRYPHATDMFDDRQYKILVEHRMDILRVWLEWLHKDLDNAL